MSSLPFPEKEATIYDLFLRCKYKKIAFFKQKDKFVLAPFPKSELVLRNAVTQKREKHFADLHELLAEQAKISEYNKNPESTGGIFGFFSYDLGRELVGVSGRNQSKTPLSAWRKYDLVISQDQNFSTPAVVHYQQKAALYDPLQYFQKTRGEQKNEKKLDFAEVYPPNFWRDGFFKTQKAIAEGEAYQLNLTKLFRADFHGDPRNFFLQILNNNPSEYAAFFGDDDYAVLSFSPELFLNIDNEKIITRPIKGTRPRGRDEESDEIQKKTLFISEKEKAELNMITDLMRNDLSQNCQSGTVKVIRDRELKALPAVWHTYAKIEGKLKNGITPLKAILDSLPCGSISGCPKKRAVELIEEFELHSRGPFCGTMGFFDDAGEITLSVLIRTFLWEKGCIYFQAGGGITYESNMAEEETEIAAKCASFFQAAK